MDNTKNDIIKRLKRIEGQVKGIQRMIEKDECCSDILIQVAAVRAAMNKVGGLILENYSKNCIRQAVESNYEEDKIDDLIETMIKFMK